VSVRARVRVRIACAAAALLGAAVLLHGWGVPLLAAPAKDAGAAAAPPVPAPTSAGAKAAAPGAAPAASDKVKITFITVPPRNAMVFWGRKRLGVIAPHQPLVVQRPRDSWPLDVIVRSPGYLSVQTRAYTFADNKVAVKLTPPDQKNTLLGYREEPPPEDPGVAVPPPPGAPAAPVAVSPDAGSAQR